MHRQRYPQRQHVIYSFDTLLTQLLTLSFFLSPSLWSFVLRSICQYQCSKPRESHRSLRFLFFEILVFNASTFWNHSTQGAAEGRAVILDFVGLSYVPSTLQLLALDLFIIFLQLVLTTIVYEISLAQSSAPEVDTLLPIPPSPSPVSNPLPRPTSSTPPPSFTSEPTNFPPQDSKCCSPPTTELPFIIDLRLATVIERLRHPPAVVRNQTDSDLFLPLPNTTQWPLPHHLRLLMRANARMRRQTEAQVRNGTTSNGPREGIIPAGLDLRDT